MVATRHRYSDVEFGEGFIAFLATVVVALLVWFIYGLVMYGHSLQYAFKYPPAHLAPSMLSGWICLAGYLLVHLLCYAIQNE